MPLLAVTYHYVRPEYDYPHPGIFGMICDQFRAQLEALSDLARFVSLQDVSEAIQNDCQFEDWVLLMTFDDGLLEQFEYALPILDNMGIPAAFFVNPLSIERKNVRMAHSIHWLMANNEITNLLNVFLNTHKKLYGEAITPSQEGLNVYRFDDLQYCYFKYLLNYQLPFSRSEELVSAVFSDISDISEAELAASLYMPAEQIIQLHRRGMIGSHGNSHCNLGLVPFDAAHLDIKIAAKKFDDILGAVPQGFCYPYGIERSCPHLLKSMLMGVGHQYAFTIERGINRNWGNPFHLGRLDCNQVPGGMSFRGDPKCFLDSLPDCQWGLPT